MFWWWRKSWNGMLLDDCWRAAEFLIRHHPAVPQPATSQARTLFESHRHIAVIIQTPFAGCASLHGLVLCLLLRNYCSSHDHRGFVYHVITIDGTLHATYPDNPGHDTWTAVCTYQGLIRSTEYTFHIENQRRNCSVFCRTPSVAHW